MCVAVDDGRCVKSCGDRARARSVASWRYWTDPGARTTRQRRVPSTTVGLRQWAVSDCAPSLSFTPPPLRPSPVWCSQESSSWPTDNDVRASASLSPHPHPYTIAHPFFRSPRAYTVVVVLCTTKILLAAARVSVGRRTASGRPSYHHTPSPHGSPSLPPYSSLPPPPSRDNCLRNI